MADLSTARGAHIAVVEAARVLPLLSVVDVATRFMAAYLLGDETSDSYILALRRCGSVTLVSGPLVPRQALQHSVAVSVTVLRLEMMAKRVVLVLVLVRDVAPNSSVVRPFQMTRQSGSMRLLLQWWRQQTCRRSRRKARVGW